MSKEIMEKLSEHTQQFQHLSEQIEVIAEKVLEHDIRFDDHDSKFDRVFKKLLEHDDRFDRIEARLDNTATKYDISLIINTLDTIVGIVKDTNQEVVFLGQRVKRVEEKVERIEPLVGLI